MECKYCGRFAPADIETGYDADDVCPDCAEESERERGDDDGMEYGDPRDELEDHRNRW